MEQQGNDGKFLPGNQLAPGGARPGSGRKPNAARELMDKVLGQVVTEAEQIKIIKTLMTAAQGGDVKAATLLLGYCWGKPVERAEVTGQDGEPLVRLILRGRDDAGNSGA